MRRSGGGAREEEDILELGSGPEGRERQQGLSSLCHPQFWLLESSLGQGKHWPGSQETRDKDAAAVVQGRMGMPASDW